eukprot:TRINITY_DN33951_c1_g1_i1.p1 TRINITY_DN33951_c1_g1~~TRINITY_DN33951_c1_g1_i1.p1  ORF type:complete len:528 (+),score=106.39 TRINITY_DN33951_c1_g1_i1:49-1584(+)
MARFRALAAAPTPHGRARRLMFGSAAAPAAAVALLAAFDFTTQRRSATSGRTAAFLLGAMGRPSFASCAGPSDLASSGRPTKAARCAATAGLAAASSDTAQAFGHAARQQLAENPGGAVFVCGNEAGDLDTIVSAFATAYGLSQRKAEPVAAIPLCPFARKEFRLRRDAQLLFQDAGFALDAEGAPAALVFWDEVDWTRVRAARPALVLTDHNAASPALAANFGEVVMIIDHHADAGSHKSAERRIDDGAGSACTLVAEWLLNESIEMPPDLGLLLLGTVLVDTRNFAEKNPRFNQRDKDMFALLEKFLPDSPLQDAAADTAAAFRAWFTRTYEARYDVGHLSVDDLLRLDYKEARAGGVRFGISGMFDSLDGLVERAGGAAALHGALQAFAEEKDLDILHCMTKAGKVAGSKTKMKGLVTFDRGATAAQRGEKPLSMELEMHLTDSPAQLPQELREVPLFESQGILQHGFGLQRREDLKPLTAYYMRGEVTRKTLMPTVDRFFRARGAKL